MGSKLEKARSAMAGLRRRIGSKEPIIAVSAVSAGALVGVLERRGTLATTMGGIPTKPLIALASYGVAMQSSPGKNVHAVFSGAGHGVAGAYGYAAGKAGTLIAGGDDVNPMDEEEEYEEEEVTGDEDEDEEEDD